ncbi:endonuclease [Psychromicrobium lacuslunae]|uniref:Ribonuclease n=1 Tax=Psychromicrobium lacuslunae TaxID=1618207 RepID=A0A0D4C002_9MICC|nr:endonuclease [Psychromicrobium lacuslunae]AJT41730.1 ribonuclease [Psychromicrobium lacuslunae]
MSKVRLTTRGKTHPARNPLAILILTAFAALQLTAALPAQAASTALTVSAAISQQNGSSQSVTGYVVGQPTATNTVVTASYPNDYALALADSASETSTSKMLYVQIPSSFRSSFGLKSNPTLKGTQLTVTGTTGAYFSHPGLTSSTAFVKGDSTQPTDPTDPTTPPVTPPTSSDYDTTYYKDAVGKTGTALRNSLHSIISVMTKINYDTVWDALQDTDQDPANSNNVIELYTGKSVPKSQHGGGVDDWNREHVFAKSHGNFGTSTGPGTDVHHLRPTDVTVNSARGNKDFDNGGQPVAEAPGNFTDSDSWEPRNAVKGDIARMLMYMAIRYDGSDGFADLELNESTSNGTNPFMGKLSILLKWSAQDPPDAFEKKRNDVIFTKWQKNRNPFIDHPEWATAIWGAAA